MQTKGPDLSVNLAGVRFPNPVGVGAIGEHWGHVHDLDTYVERNSKILLDHLKAGAGYIVITGAYITPETEKLVWEKSRMNEVYLQRRTPNVGTRSLKIQAAEPYGTEGFYFLASPFYMDAEFAKATVRRNERMMETLIRKKPKEAPIVANLGGIGSIAETWIDGAKKFEELGADVIEINLGCPLATGLGGSVDAYFSKEYSPYYNGMLVGDHPDLVFDIVSKVVKAVKIPVGVKFSPETGFPRIIGVVRAARDAGAKYVHLYNSAVGIAPPDIYNGGKPTWPNMDGSPFCMASGSFLRVACYKAVAAVGKFVPGIQIAAAGGLVEPKHMIEAMMLGATLVQPTTGVIEQGRGLIRRSISFMKKFMAEQGYDSMEQIISLGQQYIKHNEDVDMRHMQNVIHIHQDKCIKCRRCVDNLCQTLYFEDKTVKVTEDYCVGCGSCIIACPHDALELKVRNPVLV
jgi:dihydropyrimidine dehydrogenase (NAD+) subunit PreA